MAATKISTAAAIAACDAIVDLVDAGAGAGTLTIYDGTKPAGPNTAITSQTLLATLTYSDPAFGDAALVGNNGEAAANTITGDSNADANGTATWFRVADSDGNAIWDGDVGAVGSGADLELNSTSIVSGGTVAVSSHVFRVPRG